jgi:2-polyprenyl-6-methoxyphenol hydroxylase-like FAD-dependent oxidoreductase
VSPDVVICGAGVGGLAAARALREVGLDVLVLDRQRDTPQVAKGELLQPESVRILDAWAATPALRETDAVPVDRLAIRDPHGILKLNLGYRDLPGPYRSILCTRYPDVLDALTRCLDPAVEVRRGVLVEDLIRDHTGRISGVRVTQDGNRSEIPARLVIAADGPSSRLRQAAGLTATRKTYPHRLLAVELSDVDVAAEVCAYLTDRGLRLVYPLPHGRCRLYVQVHPDEFRGPSTAPPDAWCNQLVAEVPALAPLGDALRTALPRRQVLAVYRLSAPRLSTPGLVLAGEAAHAVHPMAAQGMNSCLADAEALADQIHATGDTDTAALDRALLGYQSARLARLNHTATISHNAARMLTLTPGPGQRLGRRMMRHTAANPRLVRLTAGNLSGVAIQSLRPMDRLYQLGLLSDRRANAPIGGAPAGGADPTHGGMNR